MDKFLFEKYRLPSGTLVISEIFSINILLKISENSIEIKKFNRIILNFGNLSHLLIKNLCSNDMPSYIIIS